MDRVEPPKNSVRSPRQKRSLDTKEKLIEAAYRLFCEKGLARTSPVEVARAAQVAVGSFYAYFVDKEDLFSAVLDRYKKNFDGIGGLKTFPREATGDELRAYFRALVLALVSVHEGSKTFNPELKSLYFSHPGVTAHIDRQNAEIRAVARACLDQWGADGRFADLDAWALVVTDLIDRLVDRLVFGPWPIDRNRILETGTDALVRLVGESWHPK